MSYINLSGKTFGKWTILERTDRKKVVYYSCICSCGTQRDVLSVSLRNGKSVSCGCYQPEKWSNGFRKVNKLTYQSWSGMRQRCDYSGHIEFHRYGGRGIIYDPRWKSFDAFFEDMGARPPKMSLDRVDNDKPYCKENCKWSTAAEQSSNTSRNIFVQWHGKTYTLKQLAKHLDVKYDLLHKWHRTIGLPIEAAVERALERAPVGSNKPFVPTCLSDTFRHQP